MKKILVYDKKSYFYLYIRKRFENVFLLEKVTYKLKLKSINQKSYYGLIFVAYHEEDIIYFLDFYLSGISIVVCSDNKFILEHFYKIEKITCIDIGVTKKEAYKLLSTIIKI